MINIPTRKSFKVMTAVIITLLLAAAPTTWQTDEIKAYTAPGYNGWIVFSSSTDGNGEIYRIDSNGENLLRLTNDPANDTNPMVSPDGSKIIFASDRDGHSEIYTMSINGENVTRLTNSTYGSFEPQWSPDGTKIGYRSTVTKYGPEEQYHRWGLMIADSDGSNIVNVTETLDLLYSGVSDFDWHPDGDKLAVSVWTTDWIDVYTVNSDGTNMKRLTTDPSGDYRASISPDGEKIAFYSQRGDIGIFMMNWDGTDEIQLTPPSDDWEFEPKWSPDGSRISYTTSDFDYTYDILGVIAADGTQNQLIDLRADGIFITEDVIWSGDGTSFVFTGYDSIERTNPDLYRINGDGTGLQRLTYGGTSSQPRWQLTPNAAPVTLNDALATPYNTSSTIDVLANDSDEDVLSGANLTIATQPSHGTASVVDGKVRYVPSAGYVGLDGLTYEICDSFLLDQKCSTGVVSLSVRPVVSVMKISGENYSSSVDRYVIANPRPTFSGTATPGTEIKVEIHSDPIILTTTADQAGNWSVTPSFDLPTGEHMVYVSATLNGLTTELDSFALSIGALASTGDSLWALATGGFGAVISSLAVLAYGSRTSQRRSIK